MVSVTILAFHSWCSVKSSLFSYMKTFYKPTLDNNNPSQPYSIIFFKGFSQILSNVIWPRCGRVYYDSHFIDENSDTQGSEKLRELPEVTWGGLAWSSISPVDIMWGHRRSPSPWEAAWEIWARQQPCLSLNCLIRKITKAGLKWEVKMYRVHMPLWCAEKWPSNDVYLFPNSRNLQLLPYMAKGD